MAYPWHKPAFESVLARRAQLPHALLLRGARGIGKLAFAEALAAALLCEKPGKDGSACRTCASCGWMGQGSHPDFRRLEPESLANREEAEPATEKKEKASTQISVDQARSLANFINVTSHRGGNKVVLIHPAEALNANAANALLKGLEEPPPRTYFLLVAHRWSQLLPTIRSRCQDIALPPPSLDIARSWLKAQGLGDPELALAQSGNTPLLALEFDEAYWSQRKEFLKSIGVTDIDPLAVAERLRDQPPALVVGWLQKWTFDLVSHRATGAVRYNPDFAAAITTIAGRIDPVDAVRFQRHVVRLQRIVAHPLNARLFFEQLLLIYAALLRRKPLRLAA
jgi:DNA polymerase III subunit delta'